MNILKFFQILIYNEETLTTFPYLTEIISDISRLGEGNHTFTNSRIYLSL